MRITFEKYVERMGKPLRRAAKRKAGNHPYLGEDDLFQEAMLAIWTVWNKHRRKLPFEDLCKVGWTAGIRKMITQKDRSKLRGEGVAKWVDMSGLLMIGSVALKDGRPINRGNTSEYEHDRVFVKLAVRAIEKTLSDAGRSLLGELLAPGERTLRASRELWTNRSSRNTPFWQIESKVYARSLGVPNDVAKGLLAELRWKFDVYFQSVGLSMVEGNGGNFNRGGIEMLEKEKEFVTDPLEFNGGGEEPEPEPEPEPEAGEEGVVDLDEGERDFEEPGEEGFEEGPTEKTGEKEEQPHPKEEKPKAKKAEKPKAKETEKPKAKETEKPKAKETEKPKAKEPEEKKQGSKSVAKRKVAQKREPHKKAEKKAAPKAKKASVKARAAAKTFREGTQAARVWALLEKRFAAGKTIQKADVASAYRRACKFDEERAAGSASLFMWDMLRKGLTKKVGPGEFARRKG